MQPPDTKETKDQLGAALVADNKAREVQAESLRRLTDQLAQDHEEPSWPLTFPSLTSKPRSTMREA